MSRFSLSYTQGNTRIQNNKILLSAAEVIAENLRDMLASVDDA